MPTHFLASLLAGTVATTACAPADVLKSRIQNAVSVDGVKPVSATRDAYPVGRSDMAQSLRKIVADSFETKARDF